MPSREEYNDLARAAGWRPHPLLSDQARSTQWAVPQLHLRVWSIFATVTVLAYVEWVQDDGVLVHHTLQRATWAPGARPTERQVVEWGYRALGKWLGDQMTPE